MHKEIHRRQHANLRGWHRRPLTPGSFSLPFPTQTYIPGTWKHLNLPPMPGCFTLWMLFWGKNVQEQSKNSLKNCPNARAAVQVPCDYRWMDYIQETERSNWVYLHFVPLPTESRTVSENALPLLPTRTPLAEPWGVTVRTEWGHLVPLPCHFPLPLRMASVTQMQRPFING